MSDIEIGSNVEVTQRCKDRLLAGLAKRIEGREATLVRTYTRAGSTTEHHVVEFSKKGGRGKTFQEIFRREEIEIARPTCANDPDESPQDHDHDKESNRP